MVLVTDTERLCVDNADTERLPELEELTEGDDEVVMLSLMLRVCVELAVGVLVRIADALVVELTVPVFDFVAVAVPVRVHNDDFDTDELLVDILELVEERVELVDSVEVSVP